MKKALLIAIVLIVAYLFTRKKEEGKEYKVKSDMIGTL